MPLILLLTTIVLIWFIWRHVSTRRRRVRLLHSSLSAGDREIILTQVPLLRRLPQDEATRLEGKINLFLDQVTFHGCDGLDVTDDMRLSIAAQACLLIVNSSDWYDTVRTILIYPGAFRSRQQRSDGLVVTDTDTVRLGESWHRGPVILSWAHTQEGAADDRDGKNLVFHEFAHQLDNLSGHTDGAPLLQPGQTFNAWERTFLDAYRTHVARVEQGKSTLLDPYGAEAHAEFFAVAVEAFFETPASLKREHPDVYQQLADLFRLDPAAWEKR